MRRSRLTLIVLVVAFSFVPWVVPIAQAAGNGAPANDRYSRRESLSSGTSAVGTTDGATAETDEPSRSCSGGDTGTVWYEFVAPADGTALFVLQPSSGANLGMAAFAFSGNLRQLEELKCQDLHGPGLEERLALHVKGRSRYVLAVAASQPGADGAFALSALGSAVPANDDVTMAAPAPPSGSFVDGTTLGSSLGDREPASDCTLEPFAAVWYRYTPDEDEEQRLVLESATDQGLSIWTRSATGDLTELSCVDNEYGGGVERLDHEMAAGTEYFVAVSPWFPEEIGDFRLGMEPAPEESCLGVSRAEVCLATPEIGVSRPAASAGRGR